MTLRIEFGFGIIQDKDGLHIPRPEVDAALQKIKERATQLFDGYTLFKAEGGWRNGMGRLVEEEGRTLLVYGTTPCEYKDVPQRRIAEMAAFIKKTLNQEAVYVSQQEVTLTQI